MAELTPMESAVIAAGEVNAKREGKGLRLAVASTRGKNPTPVTYESFDDSKPETLPETVAEFMQFSSVEDEATLVNFLITGYNDNSFRLASDPVAEFVEASWPDEAEAATAREVLAAEMRARLAEAKPAQGPWEAKNGPGRLMDIELCAQTLALIAASITYWVANVRRRWLAEELLDVAAQRRQPTFSPKTGPESAATISGEVLNTA